MALLSRKSKYQIHSPSFRSSVAVAGPNLVETVTFIQIEWNLFGCVKLLSSINCGVKGGCQVFWPGTKQEYFRIVWSSSSVVSSTTGSPITYVSYFVFQFRAESLLIPSFPDKIGRSDGNAVNPASYVNDPSSYSSDFAQCFDCRSVYCSDIRRFLPSLHPSPPSSRVT